MPVEPVTITTILTDPAFNVEDHRAAAAEQLGVDLGDIYCSATGPDEFERISDAVYSQDGTLLKPAVVKYHRKTTWEQRAIGKRAADPEPPAPEPVNHTQPKLPKGARWHGVVDGVEGNYVSDGTKLVPVGE
jgi:hypothetical protein